MAQSKKERKKPDKQATSQRPTAKDPKKKNGLFGSKKKSVKKMDESAFTVYDQKQREFEERMEANAKAAVKKERMMRKPQYSDPSYFGHKKKPKKRKVGRKKVCKECGLKH